MSTSLLAAERAVTGQVMLYGRRALALLDIAPGDMHHPVCAVTVQAALDLDAAGQPIDPITLQAQLERARHWNVPILANGEAAWLQMIDRAGVLDALPHYAAIVRSHALRRRMRQTLARLQALTDREPGDDEEYISEVQRIMAEGTVLTGAGEAQPMGKMVTARMTAFAERRQAFRSLQTALKGLPTGIAGIDEAINGLQDGRLYVLAGRPKMGKSSLALTWAMNCQAPCLIFNLEMTADEQTDRAIVQGTRCDAEQFAKANVTQAEFASIFQRAQQLTRLPIYLDDTSRRWAQIQIAARRWRQRYPGKALIVLDYLQLVEVGGRRSRPDRLGPFSNGGRPMSPSPW